MLKALTLDGFRSYPDAETFSLSPLTLLTGLNNAGKSSAVQAIVALTQSAGQVIGPRVLLDGDWTSLGHFDQVVSSKRVRTDPSFGIGLTLPDDRDVFFTLGPPSVAPGQGDPTLVPVASLTRVESSDSLGTTELSVDADGRGSVVRTLDSGERVESATSVLNPLEWQSEQGVHKVAPEVEPSRVQYLSGYRMPPAALYLPRRRAGPLVGSKGEYTAEVLHQRRSEMTDLVGSGFSGPARIGRAVDYWWSHVSGAGLRLRVDAPNRLGYTLRVDTAAAEDLGLGQVGLGLGHCLPIIALCVMSSPGDIVIVDTPEAHLHPASQHRLVDLFIMMVRQGRQIILETHSEHIVHAVRLAVRRGSEGGGVAAEDVGIHFIHQEDGVSMVQQIHVTPTGRLDKWPDGFFDQASKNLAELLTES